MMVQHNPTIVQRSQQQDENDCEINKDSQRERKIGLCCDYFTVIIPAANTGINSTIRNKAE